MHAGWVLPYFYGTAMITGDPDESVDLRRAVAAVNKVKRKTISVSPLFFSHEKSHVTPSP
jgi:hypothetical protein